MPQVRTGRFRPGRGVCSSMVRKRTLADHKYNCNSFAIAFGDGRLASVGARATSKTVIAGLDPAIQSGGGVLTASGCPGQAHGCPV